MTETIHDEMEETRAMILDERPGRSVVAELLTDLIYWAPNDLGLSPLVLQEIVETLRAGSDEVLRAASDKIARAIALQTFARVDLAIAYAAYRTAVGHHALAELVEARHG